MSARPTSREQHPFRRKAGQQKDAQQYTRAEHYAFVPRAAELLQALLDQYDREQDLRKTYGDIKRHAMASVIARGAERKVTSRSR